MEIISSLQRSANDCKRFKRIHVGKFTMSIQAHDVAYCCPREDGLNPSDYLSFEVAIVPRANVGIPQLFMSEFNKYRDGPTNIYGYVPADVVQDMYNMLSKV